MSEEIKDVVIRFSGDSGDGMQLTGTLFSNTSALYGNDVSTFPDYPAEIRAPQDTVSGVSGFQVHIGSSKVITPGDFCDMLVAMNPAALKANRKWLKKEATVLCDSDAFDLKHVQKAGFETENPFKELGIEDYNIILCPITSLTRDAVAPTGLDLKSATRCKNMFALGICFYVYNRPLDYALSHFDRKFAKKPLVAEANKLALKAGYNYADNTHVFASNYNIAPAALPKGKYRSVNGNQAMAWGFIAASEKSGRQLFNGSYPITPATVILEELAKRKDLGVKTMQCEDEIAGICTSIGAAWAGSLAVTSTSGPGLSLKSEALGLAVMAELPLVIVDVQRGGPSTGLPTKTEQADLNQALWGRNGECPVVVVAPTTPSDCFDTAFSAAKIAMEHMTPVLVLSDGFIANGSEPWLIPSMADYPEIKAHMADASSQSKYYPYFRDEKSLARYWAVTGTPGLEHRIGGLEKHELYGSVSHDPQNHEKMVKTRARKVQLVTEDLPAAEVFGDKEGDLLVIGWGGTFGHLRSAVESLRSEGLKVSHLHIKYVNPLQKGIEDILKGFKHIVVAELNAGQFAGYLREKFPGFVFGQYNKIQGLPFTVDELVEAFRKEI